MVMLILGLHTLILFYFSFFCILDAWCVGTIYIHSPSKALSIIIADVP